MNTKAEIMVIKREDVDLVDLARHDGPLAAPCGTIGPSIAGKVLRGNGVASVPLKDLKLAMDTQSGVQSILDHFELYDSTTRRPLLWSLINTYLNTKQ